MTSPTRRLAAIMFTDIVGYTALMAKSEETGLRVRKRHREVLRPLVERYGGEWVQHIGDETLSSFPSAVDAVNCALAIQTALQEESDLRVRIGVHLGDVVLRDSSLHGDGVNVASRIRALAEPNGICVSEPVFDLAKNQTNLVFHSMGAQSLKNIERPVEVFLASGTAAEARPTPLALRRRKGRTRRWTSWTVAALIAVAVGAWWLNQGVTDLPSIRSLAVLPLENLSGDPEQEYFADGMTEALIGDLAKIQSLRVISRTSVTQYKKARKPLPEIARELNVDGIIEGTVMRADDRVRITVQLIDARNDRHLWSERYDRELSNVLALQGDVARAVAAQVRLELSPEEQAALEASRPVDPAAYDAYLRGRELVGPESLVRSWAPRAMKHLERAVELDPGLAEAWAWIAKVRTRLGIQGLNLRDREQYPRAREAAQRALDLDDRLGMAHAVLGNILLENAWDFAGAQRECERAIELSPGDPTVVNELAWYLLIIGRSEEGLAVSERLPRIAPYDVYYRGERFRHLRFAREFDRALEELARVREVDPAFTDHLISDLYFGLGRLEEAHRASIAFYRACGTTCDAIREAEGRGWTEGGWRGSKLAAAELLSGAEGFSPTAIAMFYSLAGETEEAFAWLERGYRQREPLMIGLKGQPTFDPIRSDPRFQDLIRRIGFPES